MADDMTSGAADKAQQLGTDILAELERAVAQVDSAKESDVVVDFGEVKKIQEETRAAFAAIVSDYMAKRQALAEKARQAKIDSIRNAIAA